jgi:hypothetical protein
MDLIDVIKKAAVEAVETGEPSDFVFGTVMSAKPLKVMVDQKLILTEEFLTLTSAVIDYSVKTTVLYTDTERHQEHNPDEVELTFHNALKDGDKVIMLKSKGGQIYVILDKLIEKGGMK